MKYVSIIEDKKYLLWQQEVQAYNLKSLGELDKLCVVVLYDTEKPSSEAKSLGDICDVRYYPNLQLNRNYIPSNKPYGLMMLLKEHPEYGKDLFLIDSDVIFREVLNFEEMSDQNGMYASDCSSYLNWSYIKEKYPEDRIEKLLSICPVNIQQLESINSYSGGAQYYFKHIDWEFCEKVQLDSILIYGEMCKARDEVQCKIQVWTAEMWAWLWNAVNIYNIYTPKELEFCWATDKKTRWEETKILHLAGVINKEVGMFYKGAYTHCFPWETDDFSYVTKRDTCSWVYYEKMMGYRNAL